MQGFSATGSEAVGDESSTTVVVPPIPGGSYPHYVNPKRLAKPLGQNRILFGDPIVSTSPGFELVGDQWTIPKDPDSKRFYGVELADELAESQSTISAVTALVQGVTVLQAAGIQDTRVLVKLGGLDEGQNAVNSCIFHITLANGEEFDITIYFTLQER